MAGATVIGSMYAAGLIQDALFTGVSLPVTVGGNVLIAALASAINPLVGIGVLAHVGKTLVYPMIGMSGLGDYLTRANAAEARSLGDYLTRTNAAEARSLGSYATSMMTGDPLKDFSQAGGLNRTGLTHFAQAQRLNPYNMQGMAGAIDATAAHELSTSF